MRETYIYGDGANPVILKSEFIISLCDQLIGGSNLGAKQKSIITNVEAGHGLIKAGSSLVPFANKFPKNTSLYKLMTTKPGESS